VLAISNSNTVYSQEGKNVQSTAQDDGIPLAPAEYRRPAGYDPVPYRYKYSLRDMQEKFSESTMKLANEEYRRAMDVIEKGQWKPETESLARHQPPEWFQDMKFGMFIDWGLWSVGGYAIKMGDSEVYPDWYEYQMLADVEGPGRRYKKHGKLLTLKPYHAKNWGEDFDRGDFIPLFTAEKFNPDFLTDLAVECGMKYVIPFCKHFSGFCIWESSYTHMDVGERLGRDLMKPLVDNCRKKDLKFGFYYGTQEWEYPIIADNGELFCRTWFRGNTNMISNIPNPNDKEPGSNVTVKEWENIIPGKIPVKDFLKDYIIPQAVEFIDRYDPDILWYDGDWTTPVENLGSYEIAAYFYNKAEGKKEVAVNDRYGLVNGKILRNRLGDIYTSEYGYGKNYSNKIHHAWEENRGISQSFGFNWQDTDENVITSKQFVDMFVDIVAYGGNLLLLINLDGKGALPAIQETRLRDIGKWLKVNGEGIYSTRPYSVITENNIRYTRSKDNKTVYAISLDWPGKQLELKSVKPAVGSKVFLLGYKKPLEWNHQNGVTTILLPDKLQKDTNRPCDYAWTFRIEN
jgi:alpha-L-fucosidase